MGILSRKVHLISPEKSEKIDKIDKTNRLYQQHLNSSDQCSGVNYAEQNRLLEIYDFLQDHNIFCLYHFTDRSNLASIARSGGLLSWNECAKRNIHIPALGSNDFSRQLDKSYGLEDYVRLSFCENHPMMYVAKNEGRIKDPVVLKIDPLVACLQCACFSDVNAAAKNHNIGNTANFLRRIPFEIFSQPYFDLSDDNKRHYQAEILVPKIVPLSFMLNPPDNTWYDTWDDTLEESTLNPPATAHYNTWDNTLEESTMLAHEPYEVTVNIRNNVVTVNIRNGVTVNINIFQNSGS